MYVMIREGSSEKNLEELLPLVTDETYKRCLFVVDDRSCADLLRDGDIDAVVRKAIRLGLAPVRAIQLATLNTAERFGLPRLGAIAPGYVANLVVLERSARTARAELVFHHGQLVARGGTPLFTPAVRPDARMTRTMRVKPFEIERLALRRARLEAPRDRNRPPSDHHAERGPGAEGLPRTDRRRHAARHPEARRRRTAQGDRATSASDWSPASASNAAHWLPRSRTIRITSSPSASTIAICTSPSRKSIRLGGGLVVAASGRVIQSLPLPVAGLVSDQPLADVVRELENVEQAAGDLGAKLAAPFATLSFLALPVIPELRLTDKGLVDVRTFQLLA